MLTTDEKWEVDGLENGQPYEYTIGRRLTADFLATGSSATALIGVNDITALGILQELQEQRRGVPQEFSVCGFDNIFSASIVIPGSRRWIISCVYVARLQWIWSYPTWR